MATHEQYRAEIASLKAQISELEMRPNVIAYWDEIGEHLALLMYARRSSNWSCQEKLAWKHVAHKRPTMAAHVLDMMQRKQRETHKSK